MTWALGLLVGIKSFLADLFRWLLKMVRDYPWQAAVFALLLALLVMFWQWGKDHAALTDEISAERALVAEIRKAHAQTIENVRAGREAARALDRRNAERVRAQAAAINERTIHELETRTRTYAARTDRLLGRIRSLEAAAGGGGSAPVPGDTDATCRAFGAASCDDLVARIADAQGSIDKLIALQAWARDVAAIDTNGEPE